MTIHDISMTSITGEEIAFSEYKEQALLIVNLASQWGLTPQYTGLCALEKQRDDLIGFCLICLRLF